MVLISANLISLPLVRRKNSYSLPYGEIGDVRVNFTRKSLSVLIEVFYSFTVTSLKTFLVHVIPSHTTKDAHMKTCK